MSKDKPLFVMPPQPLPRRNNLAVDRELWTGVPCIVPRPGDQDLPDRQMEEGTVRPAERPDNMDIDREMWTFYTEAPRRPSPEAPPNGRRPEVPTSRKQPPRRPPFMPTFGERVAPPHQEPSVWARPVQQVGDDCLGFYETEYTLISYSVPDTRMLIIEEVGYELDEAAFPVGDIVTIRVRRNGEVLGEWQDMVAAADPNPVKRYAFGSFLSPVPFRLRVDRTQQVTVSVVAHGALPFNKTSADPLNGDAKAVLYGYLDQLRDTREGGFRPRVDGTERGKDRFNYVPEAAARYLSVMGELQPYFDERFTDADMALFYDEMNTTEGYHE